MFDYSALYASLHKQGLGELADYLQNRVDNYFATLNHGDVKKWQAAFNTLPEITASQYSLQSDAVSIGAATDINNQQQQLLDTNLKALMPWRKGPFNLFGTHIDSEWQCQLKWQRLADYINLQDKRVLDVGCGNGYYMCRMLGAGAKQVVGIDPMLRFIFQFEAIKKYLQPFIADSTAAILPLSMQDMPKAKDNIQIGFDTALSMGVLYHRRDPVEHLQHLHDCILDGGELILETLIIDEGTQWGDLLEPAKDPGRNKRYAMMGNVWNVPTVSLLQSWAQQAGFTQIKVCDVSITDFTEQRGTEWMVFHSLQEFLNPENPQETVEGYPAPKRVILHCN